MKPVTMRRPSAVVLLSLLLAGSGIVKADTYNLSADWSDIANPNGPWSYYVNDILGTSGTRSGDAFVTPPGAPPIWGNAASTFVGWSKNNGSELAGWDLELGDVYGHTPAGGSMEIRWTSPITGEIEVSGGTWAIRDVDRWNSYEFTHNGTVLGSGTVGDGDAWSRSNPAPLNFALDVIAGDILAFRVAPVGTADYVAVDLNINPVPVPGAVILGVLGLSVAGWRLKRKSI